MSTQHKFIWNLPLILLILAIAGIGYFMVCNRRSANDGTIPLPDLSTLGYSGAKPAHEPNMKPPDMPELPDAVKPIQTLTGIGTVEVNDDTLDVSISAVSYGPEHWVAVKVDGELVKWDKLEWYVAPEKAFPWRAVVEYTNNGSIGSGIGYQIYRKGNWNLSLAGVTNPPDFNYLAGELAVGYDLFSHTGGQIGVGYRVFEDDGLHLSLGAYSGF